MGPEVVMGKKITHAKNLSGFLGNVDMPQAQSRKELMSMREMYESPSGEGKCTSPIPPMPARWAKKSKIPVKTESSLNATKKTTLNTTTNAERADTPLFAPRRPSAPKAQRETYVTATGTKIHREDTPPFKK